MMTDNLQHHAKSGGLPKDFETPSILKKRSESMDRCVFRPGLVLERTCEDVTSSRPLAAWSRALRSARASLTMTM